MKITLSKRQRLTFRPKVVDRKATEEAKAAVPPEDRKDVEDVEVDADYSLKFWPLSLAQEEEVLSAVQDAPTDADGNARPRISVINRTFATALCGWDGIYEDDKESVAFQFDPEWEGASVPDQVVQAFDIGIRAQAFSFLLDQAGARAEEVVGKPE